MTLMTDRVGAVTDGGADAVPETPKSPKETLSYEQARDKLAAVVKRLEAGGLTLEQSLELWERGERLARSVRRVAGRRASQARRRHGQARRLRSGRGGGHCAFLKLARSDRPLILPSRGR